LRWESGDVTPKNITIELKRDEEFEPVEQFTVSLENASGASLSEPTSLATVTILEQHAAIPTLSELVLMLLGTMLGFIALRQLQ
jgi:hypothetical protein